MNQITFTDDRGTFRLRNADRTNGLYVPLASERGLKSCMTPWLGGDAKLDQNHFLLEPVSIDDLAESRSTRNFWLVPEQGTPWSATGRSARQLSAAGTEKTEEMLYEAGPMWQRVTRTCKDLPLQTQITSFLPWDKTVEVHVLRIAWADKARTQALKSVTFTPWAAIPMYGRSADNLRDHRHVTSLLNRIRVTEYGVHNKPAMSFDERGHQENHTIYYVDGLTQDGAAPERFVPVKEDFIGEDGTLENPRALRDPQTAGRAADGQEAMGAFAFAPVTLHPGERRSFIVLVGAAQSETEIAALHGELCDLAAVEAAFEETKAYWRAKADIRVHTGDAVFDSYMQWVAFQPELRRLFGCSFLPHHDYGRGGRGWRDLWQDCLALLLLDPECVRGLLLSNFAGVRADGTNATIIGEAPGEFKADRNSITRVWMDHAMWPLMTTQLYLDQTGDYDFLFEEQRYFDDGLIRRGTHRRADERQSAKHKSSEQDMTGTWRIGADGAEDRGTVLEHLLVENLTAIRELGAHGCLRLRDADWNDALDMASERGESVAFTHAYVRNLHLLSVLLHRPEVREHADIRLLPQLAFLLEADVTTQAQGEQVLRVYEEACEKPAGRIAMDPLRIADRLDAIAAQMTQMLRKTQWLQRTENEGWFVSYYDNDGQPLDRISDGAAGQDDQMLLTGQVFAILGGTATDEQVLQIARAADRLLYDEACGGYRLNTDFHEVKYNMGRMFGFAYGEKENGAVFSHMAVMYANALYTRGFAAEGRKALHALYRQAADTAHSRMLPGIPEYFGRGGRGLYSYLTGAGSWYLMTVVQEMFGVKGEAGDLVLQPALCPDQFDGNGMASIALPFAGVRLEVQVERGAKERRQAQEEQARPGKTLAEPELQGQKAQRALRAAYLDGAPVPVTDGQVRLTREQLRTGAEKGRVRQIRICL